MTEKSVLNGGAATPSLSLVDLGMVSALKYVTEKGIAMTPVGNGTYVSGAVKIGLAIGADMMIPGKIGKISSAALMIDGVEDLINNAMPLVLSATGLGSSEASSNAMVI